MNNEMSLSIGCGHDLQARKRKLGILEEDDTAAVELAADEKDRKQVVEFARNRGMSDMFKLLFWK